jgi:hypothetical protein
MCTHAHTHTHTHARARARAHTHTRCVYVNARVHARLLRLSPARAARVADNGPKEGFLFALRCPRPQFGRSAGADGRAGHAEHDCITRVAGRVCVRRDFRGASESASLRLCANARARARARARSLTPCKVSYRAVRRSCSADA